MKKNLKRTLSIMLVLVMMIPIFAMPVDAFSGVKPVLWVENTIGVNWNPNNYTCFDCEISGTTITIGNVNTSNGRVYLYDRYGKYYTTMNEAHIYCAQREFCFNPSQYIAKGDLVIVMSCNPLNVTIKYNTGYSLDDVTGWRIKTVKRNEFEYITGKSVPARFWATYYS